MGRSWEELRGRGAAESESTHTLSHAYTTAGLAVNLF